MNQFRGEKITELVRELAADFMLHESSGTALITITRVVVSDDGKYATIFFTVFPPDREAGVLDFAKRKRSEFKAYVRDHSRIRVIPFFDFEIDNGEKNRQRLDDLSREDEAKKA